MHPRILGWYCLLLQQSYEFFPLVFSWLGGLDIAGIRKCSVELDGLVIVNVSGSGSDLVPRD